LDNRKEWKVGAITKLSKKEDLKLDLRQCENWREITLLTTINKIFAYILFQRLSSVIYTAG